MINRRILKKGDKVKCITDSYSYITFDKYYTLYEDFYNYHSHIHVFDNDNDKRIYGKYCFQIPNLLNNELIEIL